MKLLPTCYVSLIVMTAMMAGCNKNSGNAPPPPPPDGDTSKIYLAGKSANEPAGPAYWKGVEQVNLTAQ
jgi:hypothetical protein